MIKKVSFFLLCLLASITLVLPDSAASMTPKRKRRSSIFAAAIDAPEATIDTDASFDDTLSPAQEDIATIEDTTDSTNEYPTMTDRAVNHFFQEAAMGDEDDAFTQEDRAAFDAMDQEEALPDPSTLPSTYAEPEDIQLMSDIKGGIFDQALQQMADADNNQPAGEPTDEEPTRAKERQIEVLHKPQEIVKREAKERLAQAKEEPTIAPEPETIEFYFENADIQNLLTQISELYDVTFIADDIFDPMSPAGKALKGNKISFKTHKPLSKTAAWGLFLTFLDLSGFALVKEPQEGYYRVVTADAAQRSPVPSYIGVEPDALPNNDQVVRYVYFIENARIDILKDIVQALKSPNARAIFMQQLKAFVITDKAYNIKSMMQIVKELDQVTMPESMSVLKLTRADAVEVKKLYDTISKSDEGGTQPSRMFSARKQPTSIYFPENARIIAEPRTNALILLGSVDAIQKIEHFITKYVDVELEKPYSPLYTYQLRYANAVTITDIMSQMTQYAGDTPAGKTGGVRGGDKYLKPMSFTAEPATNSIIIKGDYEDYIRALEVIKKLDEPQPQVAVEALILAVNFEDAKELGTQLRNKVPGVNGLLGNNVDFQTSGIRLGSSTASGIQTREEGTGATRLLANLLSLVVNKGAGNTVISLGYDAFGVWGIFNILQSITNTQVVSNPFLVATNKTKSMVQVGQIRRVVTSTIFAGTEPQDAFGDFSANLKLEVTPQINSDGMIVLDLDVLIENFISPIQNEQQVAKQERKIQTKTIVADKEVIALGGLIQNRIDESLTKVPILGDIPILGWLFRNKRKDVRKDNLLILISTRIIEPEVAEVVDEHTRTKIEDYHTTLDQFKDIGEYRDPVYRRFFDQPASDNADAVEEFLFKRANAEIPVARDPLANTPLEQRPAELYQEIMQDDPEQMKEAVHHMPLEQRELTAQRKLAQLNEIAYLNGAAKSDATQEKNVPKRRMRDARRCKNSKGKGTRC